MGSRRHGTSEVTFDDRRERDYVSRNGSRYDDRYTDQEIEFRRSAPTMVRERDRDEIDIRESRRTREPAFLREDYGRTSAGPVVLRAREREDFDFVSRPRRRSPSPEDRKVERESIVIRRDERERSRGPPPQEERERDTIIIRRDERSRSRPPAKDDRETERIVIRRREDDDVRSHYEPPKREWDREEIIIRRDEDERSYAAPRRDIDYALVRPKSRERERSTMRRDECESEDIVIRKDEKTKRGRSSNREREREEIIITRERSRSLTPSPPPSPAPSSHAPTPAPAPPPPPEPQVVYAPQIHQEVITHHRHIDHGYEVQLPPRPRPVSRPPSPPSPPPPPPPEPVRERSEERIEIRRTGERNGRTWDEDIIIDRNEGARSVPPPRRDLRWRDEREEEEIDYYSSRDVERSYARPEPPPSASGDIGRRYGKTPDPKAGLWTEITKDLVIKEAIQEMGYEYEETEDFYYVIAYLKYEDVARLVGLSEDIRKDRRKRIKEIEWEARLEPEEPPPRRLAIEPPAPVRSPRSGHWSREDDRYIEREVVYRGSRPPPPPPGWRR